MIWVDRCDTTAIAGNGTCAPSVIRVFGYYCAGCISNGDNVTLKIFDEVVGRIVVNDTTYAFLIVIERNQRVTSPRFTENFCTIERIGMLYTVNSLARSDTVCIVGILDVIEPLKLSALFPSCRCAEVVGRVAVCIFIISYQPLFVKKNSAPSINACGRYFHRHRRHRKTPQLKRDLIAEKRRCVFVKDI